MPFRQGKLYIVRSKPEVGEECNPGAPGHIPLIGRYLGYANQEDTKEFWFDTPAGVFAICDGDYDAAEEFDETSINGCLVTDEEAPHEQGSLPVGEAACELELLEVEPPQTEPGAGFSALQEELASKQFHDQIRVEIDGLAEAERSGLGKPEEFDTEQWKLVIPSVVGRRVASFSLSPNLARALPIIHRSTERFVTWLDTVLRDELPPKTRACVEALREGAVLSNGAVARLSEVIDLVALS
jgi:hypothetical protein